MPSAKTQSAQYAATKSRAAKREALISTAGRRIGKLPETTHPEWYERGKSDFRFFCETYFPATFAMAWSPDHLRVIALIEAVVLGGGLFAVAMPRGSGKTSLCEVGCLWAILYGHRPAVAYIGPDESHAEQRIKNIKSELEYNDRLLEGGFRGVCWPIRKLEGIAQRRLLDDGHGDAPIKMEFTSKRLVLPNVERLDLSQTIIYAAGITGQIRGFNYKRHDGQMLRPSLVIIDDPQTRESASSPSQCEYREKIINGDILGLAGPGKAISAIMPCTVVRSDDLAERLLDRGKNPQWQGERTKMVYEWGSGETHWRKYVEMRKAAQRERRKPTDADAYYKRHRKAMDAGSHVAWEERKTPSELSALQSAWNLRADLGDAAFFAEYQNEPLPEVAPDDDLMTADEIAAKVGGQKRSVVPLECTRLTAFVDIQQKALFWLVAAWSDDFTGQVIDYGTEPDQKSEYFTLREVRRTLLAATPKAGIEGCIYAGLGRLAQVLLGKEWRREDGLGMRIDRCLVDANWGQSTAVVKKFCRESPFGASLMASHGRYVGASSVPMDEYRRKTGERVGLNWRVVPGASRHSGRHVIFDTNYWKSFVHARLGVAKGDPGCLTLCAGRSHRMLAEHLTAEYRVRTQGRGRTVDEWKLRADGLDNHWFDCLVGAAVAASITGVVLEGTAPKKRAVAKRISKPFVARW